MTKTLLTTLAIVLALHGLVVLTLLGYALATGRLDAEKRQQYHATWNGQKLVPPPPEVVEEVVEETPQEASQRIASDKLNREILSREMQMQLQLLQDMKTTVAAAQNKLLAQRQEHLQTEKEFTDQIAQYDQTVSAQGFQKALARFSQMKSKNVKDDFMKMDDYEVVRYIAEMKVDTAKKILDAFKTDAEKEKRLTIMKLLEEYKKVAINPDNMITTEPKTTIQ